MNNRQIKFRVWNKNCYQWMHSVVIDCIGNIESHFFEVKENQKSLERFTPLSQDNNILQQFTGLLDKHGKEIYEGDIINYTPFNLKEYKNTRVKVPFLNSFHWFSELKEMIEENNTVEVIGNIFENPELLEKK